MDAQLWALRKDIYILREDISRCFDFASNHDCKGHCFDCDQSFVDHENMEALLGDLLDKVTELYQGSH